MVEYNLQLDAIFGSLADPIRRDILQRVGKAKEALSVSDIAKAYDLTLAGISKHLKILEKAKLVIKRRLGKKQMVELSPAAFQDATEYLKHYEKIWNTRLDSLEQYLKTL
jgi:DNA-binding transcriptional ArsR family regulator